jgi:HK97 family phage prohead protease
MNEIERRSFNFTEIRANSEGEPKIEGHAAVFDQLSEDLGGFFERIAQGAFSNTILDADVRALWNHNPDFPLARTKSGTLTLGEDEKGLAFSLHVPDTQYARDLLVSLKRGDVSQMSFGFRTLRDKWENVDGKIIRTLLEVELYDVSPVTYPAYPQTSAAVRSRLEAIIHADQVVSDEARGTSEAQARNATRKRKLQLMQIQSIKPIGGK